MQMVLFLIISIMFGTKNICINREKLIITTDRKYLLKI